MAEQQHGVVARGQLLEAGLTAGRIDGRVRAGRLPVVHRGVYLLGSLRGALPPPRWREMAAVLACGPGSAVSHESAGSLWDIRPPRDTERAVDVTVPGADRRRPGVRAHRVSALRPGDVTNLEGIPVTTAARTLLDLAAAVGTRALEQAVARAQRLDLVDGSEAEERLLALIRRGGLPSPETNLDLAGHEVDLLWRSAGVVVEVDGFAYHSARRSFEHDRRRDAELAARGVRVVRVTWRQLTEEPDALLARLARTLAHAETRSPALRPTGWRPAEGTQRPGRWMFAPSTSSWRRSCRRWNRRRPASGLSPRTPPAARARPTGSL